MAAKSATNHLLAGIWSQMKSTSRRWMRFLCQQKINQQISLRRRKKWRYDLEKVGRQKLWYESMIVIRVIEVAVGKNSFGTRFYASKMLGGKISPNTHIFWFIVCAHIFLSICKCPYFVVVHICVLCLYLFVIYIKTCSYFVFVFLYLSVAGLGYITRKHSAEWPSPNSHQSLANRLSLANFQCLLLNNNQTAIEWTVFI